MTKLCPLWAHTMNSYGILFLFKVISFDASTSVEEFTNRYVCSRVGVRSLAVSGFALFTDNPVEPNIEHFIPGSAKVSYSESGCKTIL